MSLLPIVVLVQVSTPAATYGISEDGLIISSADGFLTYTIVSDLDPYGLINAMWGLGMDFPKRKRTIAIHANENDTNLESFIDSWLDDVRTTRDEMLKMIGERIMGVRYYRVMFGN